VGVHVKSEKTSALAADKELQSGLWWLLVIEVMVSISPI